MRKDLGDRMKSEQNVTEEIIVEILQRETTLDKKQLKIRTKLSFKNKSINAKELNDRMFARAIDALIESEKIIFDETNNTYQLKIRAVQVVQMIYDLGADIYIPKILAPDIKLQTGLPNELEEHYIYVCLKLSFQTIHLKFRDDIVPFYFHISRLTDLSQEFYVEAMRKKFNSQKIIHLLVPDSKVTSMQRSVDGESLLKEGHVIIKFLGNEIDVEDLHSRNGTFYTKIAEHELDNIQSYMSAATGKETISAAWEEARIIQNENSVSNIKLKLPSLLHLSKLGFPVLLLKK